MPIELGIWRISGGLHRLPFSSLAVESKLEEALHRDISILDPGLMVVGRQVATDFGKFIDLLAVDAQGDLVVVELKRARTPREVVAQVLDYGSWVEGLTYDRIVNILAEKHPDHPFEKAFEEHFGVAPPESLNGSHRLIIVASELDSGTERIINYLSASFGVPINAVFFRYFEETGNEYLARTWLIDPNEAEVQSTKPPTPGRAKKEPWNGRDYYVSLGEGPHRTWEDCRRYGFVSAGQGRWYSRSLQSLSPGNRVFACVPEKGYVGVGTVMDAAVPVREFTADVGGEQVPILDAPLSAKRMDENADDPILSEYVVRIEWEVTREVDDAVWERGMFANQNSACKLRSKFTLDKLATAFGLED